MVSSLSGLWWDTGVGESGWYPAAPSTLSPWRSPAGFLVLLGDWPTTPGATRTSTLVPEGQGECLHYILPYLQRDADSVMDKSVIAHKKL